MGRDRAGFARGTGPVAPQRPTDRASVPFADRTDRCTNMPVDAPSTAFRPSGLACARPVAARPSPVLRALTPSRAGAPKLARAATLAAAKKSADAGEFDKATASAKEAEALAKASIFQATSEKTRWKEMEIR